MNFKEKHLVEKLEKILKKQFGTNIAFKELSAGYGIADLVFAEDFSFTRRNAAKRPPITNYAALQVFLNMAQGKLYSLDELTGLLSGSPRAEIKRHLSTLEKSGYIRGSEHLYQKVINEGAFNPIKKVIAIEAKLSDHKNGLIQARRYQYFADESYLAILKGTMRETHIQELKQYNIGLILFDKETSSIEIFHPTSASSLLQNNLNVFAKEIMLDSFSRSVSLAQL